MSLFDTIQTAYTGLQAADAGITATAHNVANATTEGYTRREVTTSTVDPVAQNGLWVGQGVSVDQITRNVDSILGGRRLVQSGVTAEAEAEYQALSFVEPLFEDFISEGVSDKLDQFFDSLQAATADPSDPTLRLQVAQAGDALAKDVNSSADGLDAVLFDLESTVEALGPDINARLQEVAALNDAIVAAGGPLAAGDLADQQDVLLRGLAEDFGFTAEMDANGQATVFLGGQAVVSGGIAREVVIETNASGEFGVKVAVDSGLIDVTDQVGGAAGGYLSAIETTKGYIEELDSMMVDFVDAINLQHAAGFDANGTIGTDLFTYDPADPAGTMSFSSAILDDPNLLAFAGDPSAAVGDDGNLLALIDFETSPVVDGTSSLADALSTLKAQVGYDVAAAEATADAENAALADLDELYSSLYGVDLDEEATNLIMYQSAYEASAKVIQVTDAMLDTLIGLIR